MGLRALVTAHPAPAFRAEAALLTRAVESSHTDSGEDGNRMVRVLKLPSCNGREATVRHPLSQQHYINL